MDTNIIWGSERRRRRSSETYEAIRFQLEYVLEEHALSHFVLADERGLVLSCAGVPDEADVLAAYAPMLARCTDRERLVRILHTISTFLPQLDLDAVRVREFKVDELTLYLVLAGCDDGLSTTGLYRALTGVRRIFRTTVGSIIKRKPN